MYSRKCVVCRAVKPNSSWKNRARVPADIPHSSQQLWKNQHVHLEIQLWKAWYPDPVSWYWMWQINKCVLSLWPKERGIPARVKLSSLIRSMTLQPMQDVKGSREMMKWANLIPLMLLCKFRMHLVTINFICGYLLLKIFETVWHIRVIWQIHLESFYLVCVVNVRCITFILRGVKEFGCVCKLVLKIWEKHVTQLIIPSLSEHFLHLVVGILLHSWPLLDSLLFLLPFPNFKFKCLGLGLGPIFPLSLISTHLMVLNTTEVQMAAECMYLAGSLSWTPDSDLHLLPDIPPWHQSLWNFTSLRSNS